MPNHKKVKMPKTHNILLTRELSDQQLELAESLGLAVTVKPSISISYRKDWFSVQNSVEKTDNLILAFTSQNGVEGFERFLKAGLEFPAPVRVYAVGGKTAEALTNAGFDDLKTPEQQDGVGLANLVISDVLNNPDMKDSEVLHFCGDRRRDEFRHYLSESKIKVKDIVVYSTRLNEMDLSGGLKKYDGILFYSPSAVQAFRNSGGFTGNELPELFAIGNTTAEELSIESGKHVHVSPEPDTEVFLRFVARVLESERVPLRRGKSAPEAWQGDDPAKNLFYNHSLKDLARQLRNNSTKSEIRLWTELLSGKKTGYTFLRQRPVLNYIADFLCKELKLIIELDGYSHEFEQVWKKDKKRQTELEEAGFKVLRFGDDEVIKDLRNVESEIMYWIKKLEQKVFPSTYGG